MRYFKIAVGLFLISILVASTINAAPGSSVNVTDVTGNVEFLAQGAASWETLEKGMRLRSGDSVKTKSKSSATFAFDSRKRNLVTVKQNSHVVLKLAGSEKLELIDGEVFALVKNLPRGSSFEIRTPTAVCGARGTGWGVIASQMETIVRAFENDSYVMGIDESGDIIRKKLIVLEGFETTIKRFQMPSKLTKISDSNYQKWRDAKKRLEKLDKRIKKLKERLVNDLGRAESRRERLEDKKADDRAIKKKEETSSGSGTNEYPVSVER